MPLPVATHGHTTTEAFLWGLLPDNDRVLERWGREFQVSPRNAFSLLGTPIGEDCAGAVQLVRQERIEHAQQAGDVTWLTDNQISDRLAELRRDATAWLPASETGQFSLAGAQAKTALLYDPDRRRWGFPSGRMPTTHILKPAIHGFDEHDLNEHLCLTTARRLGLSAVVTTVQRFGEQSAVVVRRYDRLRRGDSWLRVHQEDLCQAFGISPVNKYQNEGGPSPERIVQLFRERIHPPERAEEAAWQFVDALALNWLLAATDAHSKNYSLLLAGSQVRLAPLYDIASALPYEIGVQRLKLAMKIGGEYRLQFLGVRNWRKTAASLKLDEQRLLHRVAELADQLPDAFADTCKGESVAELDSSLAPRLQDLVADRAAQCRRWLSTG
jgi:serine/threonine-protein kinase HipA